jgi:DNA-binding MarR family transcriptional regulator
MPNPKFDTLIHGQNRLQICALLEASAEIEFQVLREKLQVSDSVLSKHLKSLVDANYVRLVKPTDMGRPRTWLSLTHQGQAAYSQHLLALQQIVGSLNKV